MEDPDPKGGPPLLPGLPERDPEPDGPTSDDLWEAEDDPPVGRQVFRAALRCAGLGLVAGAVEALVQAGAGAAPLSPADRATLGLAAVGADAALGFALGGVLALLLPLGRSSSARMARVLALAAGLLAGLYLWDGARTLLGESRTVGAAVFALLPVFVMLVVFYNARFWLVRADRGQRPAPWLPVAGALALAGLGGSLGVAALRDTRAAATAVGSSVVLVTVEGLRADDRGPALEQLAAEGLRFDNAITPASDARPATASALTGVHPLRLELLDDTDRLARGWRTVAEVTAEAGFATAAFVPSARVGAAAGLAQGFRVFDDRYRPSWTRARLLSLLVGEPGSRSAPATVRAFEGWLADHADRPFFAWVHLPDPPADEALANLRAALERHGLLARASVIVVGAHGRLAGAHGGIGNRTLYDEVVHVPIVVRTPERPLVPVVSAQVRLMDVASTLLVAAGLPALDEGEGVALLDYGTGLRKATMWTTIVGRDLDGSPLIGLRNNGIKYIVHSDGREELYDANTDPGERLELGAEQPATLEQARELLVPDRQAHERLGRAR